MSGEVRKLLGRALTRLLNGDKEEFNRLTKLAEHEYKKDNHLYVTVKEILESKGA